MVGWEDGRMGGDGGRGRVVGGAMERVLYCIVWRM